MVLWYIEFVFELVIEWDFFIFEVGYIMFGFGEFDVSQGFFGKQFVKFV